MVVLVMQVKAELEACAALKFPSDHYWTLDVKRSDGDETRERITVFQGDQLEVPNSKNSHCNFMVKFEDARQFSTINIVEDSTRNGPLKGRKMGLEYRNGQGEWQDIIAFECRGLEPVKYHWTGGYAIERENGKDFEEEIDLEEGEWCGYDEATGESVMLGRLQARFVVAGKK